MRITFIISLYTIRKQYNNRLRPLTTDEIPSHTHGSKSLVGSFSHHGDENGSLMRSYSGIVSGTVKSNQYKAPPSTSGGASSYQGCTIDATHEHNSVGGGSAHNNLPPYITLNYIIKS